MLAHTLGERCPVRLRARAQLAAGEAVHPLPLLQAHKLAVAAQDALVEHAARQVRTPLIFERPQMANRDPRTSGDGFQLHATLDPLLLKISSEPHVHLRYFRARRDALANYREIWAYRCPGSRGSSNRRIVWPGTTFICTGCSLAVTSVRLPGRCSLSRMA